MTTAIILINVKHPELTTVIEKLLELKGVSEVYAIAGEYDLATVIRAKDIYVISKIINDMMPHNLTGIIRTKTLISHKSFSKSDLENCDCGQVQET